MAKILVVDDAAFMRKVIRDALTKNGYTDIYEAVDGADAVEKYSEIHPDLVLMDIKMPLLDGLSAARIMNEERCGATIVLLTAYSEREFIDSAKEIGVNGYLVKPIDEKSIIPSIELAVARSREIRALQNDIAKVEKRLESRTMIEKAKGKIMARDGMTEQEAYDFIRKLSQTKNLSMLRVSEIILQSMES